MTQRCTSVEFGKNISPLRRGAGGCSVSLIVNDNKLVLSESYGTSPSPLHKGDCIRGIISLFFHQFKVFLGYTAERASPIVRNSFEWSAWSDTAIWVTYCWVIYPITNCAYILFHNYSVLYGYTFFLFSDAKVKKIFVTSNR